MGKLMYWLLIQVHISQSVWIDLCAVVFSAANVVEAALLLVFLSLLVQIAFSYRHEHLRVYFRGNVSFALVITHACLHIPFSNGA